MISSDFSLISSVAETVRRQRLFLPGDSLVVALSGGADSAALLDLLSCLPGYNLRLIAAHLNHSLRGSESDADEEFCRDLASSHAIPFESRRVDVKKLASENQLNLEDAGRRARIQFLDEISLKYGTTAVALAHHGDDQAETVLMRLLRGSGMTGLSGMAYRNARGYVRPLLDICRQDIEQYLCRRGLEWREDASNSDTAYLRNRIRHQLLPLLEEYNPSIRISLAATATILGDDEGLLDELTAETVAESCRMEEGGMVSSVAELRTVKPALRRRVLRHSFKQAAGTLEGLTLRHINAMCELIDSDRPNSRLNLPHAVTAVREYDRLILKQTGETVLRSPSTPIDAAQEDGFELLISAPGTYLLPTGGSIRVDESASAAFPADPGSACFDLGKIPFPWLIRTFRSGDRMTPFGMSGRKKVKDIFIDRKIPLSERRRIPLLFCGYDLIWIAGVCASEKSRIDAKPVATVRVTLQR